MPSLRPKLLPVLLAAALAACSDASHEAAAWSGEPILAAGAGASAPVAAAVDFVAALEASRREGALFAFDDAERMRWTYVPRSRSGIALCEMDDAERSAAFALLETGLSARGIDLARGIVALEGTLRDIEAAQGSFWAARRDPGRYHLALFGRPSDAHPWGWRFEGHHLSVNATALGQRGQVVAPLFIGANPARVPSGPQQGLRLLAAEQDLAFELLRMLEPAQRERAIVAARTSGDIVSRDDPVVTPMPFAGLPAGDMSDAQRHLLRRLLERYAGRMADAAAASQLQRIDEAGFARLHFAWAGAEQPGEAHYYRIHGPTVLVEYDNSQGGANHIHTVWRDLQNDFGGDLLREHYARHAHGD